MRIYYSFLFRSAGFHLLQHMFSGPSALGQVEARLHHLHLLHAMVIKALPLALRPDCHSVYWSEKILVINITRTTAISKIRQLCPSLVESLQQQGVELKKIRPKIFFDHNKPVSPSKVHRMTSAALAAFQQLEQRVTDPGLKQAISSLLEAHQQLTNQTIKDGNEVSR